ncbi:enoyl-CoA hydratase [Hydrogenophaga sp. T4]|nr:enoyl-CoA hydratase [Hydrogenophaga sp. T4]
MSNFLVVRQGDTERWTLNDPATRNALSDTLVLALFEACLRAKQDTTLRGIVLSGAGGAFSAGAAGWFRQCHRSTLVAR